MSDTSDDASRASSPSDHAEHCRFHGDARAGLCNGLTYAKTLCKYRAKISQPGYLPVCRMHLWPKETRRAGKCQALEDCGQLCNRLAKHQPPYHLCEKHRRGSDTLPCHLLRIPTELRLMVFRCLFPPEVQSYRHNVKVAILKVNRQIYQEASSVLYDEHYFQATVGERTIHLQGKEWTRDPARFNKTGDYTVSSMLCQAGASRIRKLEVSVTIRPTSRSPKGIGSRGITREEYELYILRDSVRKLAEVLGSDDPASGSLTTLRALKSLIVKPCMSPSHEWSSDEAAVALFLVLEPLQGLHGLQHAEVEHPTRYWAFSGSNTGTFVTRMQTRKIYNKLRQQCLDALKEPNTIPKIEQFTPTDALRDGYRKLEAFAQLIKVQSASAAHSWMTGVFQNMERPLHLARVAYDNNDSEMITSIHEAIKLRWINAHRQQQSSLRAVADSINTMFEDETVESENDEGDDRPTPRELFPDAFQFEEVEPLKAPYAASQSNMWTELETGDEAPNRNDPGVTIHTSGMWRTIRKGNKKWVRLTTPAVIREIQAEKGAKPQT